MDKHNCWKKREHPAQSNVADVFSNYKQKYEVLSQIMFAKYQY
jgi:hypothetical protein